MPLLSDLPGPFDYMVSRGLLKADLFSVFLSGVDNDTTSFVAFGQVDDGGSVQHYTPPLITVAQDALQ